MAAFAWHTPELRRWGDASRPPNGPAASARGFETRIVFRINGRIG